MKKNKIKLRLTVALTAMALTLTVALGNILNSKSVYQTAYGEELNEYVDDINLDRALAPVLDINITTIGTVEEGQIIRVPIRFMALREESLTVCILKFSYDTKLFENVKVIPGDLCPNPETDFNYKVSEDGEICMKFGDSTGIQRDTLDKNAIFATVYLEVKPNTPKQILHSALSFNQEESVVFDENFNEVDGFIGTVWDSENGYESPIVSIKESGSSISNCISPEFIIRNTENRAVDLKDIMIRYYYTADGNEDETFNCYYAGTTDGEYKALTSNVVGNIVKLNEKFDNADSYIELTFNGGTLDAGQSMVIQTSVNKNNWTTYDRSNDFSYDNSEHVSIFRNNILINGTKSVPHN